MKHITFTVIDRALYEYGMTLKGEVVEQWINAYRVRLDDDCKIHGTVLVMKECIKVLEITEK